MMQIVWLVWLTCIVAVTELSKILIKRSEHVKAAALGNKQAMRDIAFMYEYGLGVEKNLEIANIELRKERFNRFIFLYRVLFLFENGKT